MSDINSETLAKQIKDLLYNFLQEERAQERLISCEKKGENYFIEYDRTNLDSQRRQELEDNLSSSLTSENLKEEQLFFLPTSKDDNDVYKSQENTTSQSTQKVQTASLKVGHGQITGKKPIPGVKHIIAIGSGKGGVGKSTCSANIALALKNSGHKVGIIDADIYGPSMPMLFGKRKDRPSATEDNRILPVESHGIKFMSFGFFVPEDEPVIWRGPMLGGVLNQFFFDTEWGELDYLIIDLPPGTGDTQLSMIQNLEVNSSIIVSTPQDVALLDARKALRMFHKMELPVLGMVENMSSFICDECGKEHFLYGSGGVEKACHDLKVDLLGQIPLELELREGSDSGSPYMAQNNYEGRAAWNAYQAIAVKLDAFFQAESSKEKGFFGKFLKN